jgi:CheY-like chemotaxis protein
MTTIAIVEDNADNRLLLQAILDGLYDLVEYENGTDALAGLAASLPDLVLLDISLPGMDGNEILSRIRADRTLRTLPVIALTAHAMSGDREKYLAAGFNDYITKPIVDETILLSAIDRWLAATRSGQGRADPAR